MPSSDLSVAKLNTRGLELVREQLAPEATADELEWFAAVANHLKLDPFRQHIVLIARFDKRVGRKVHKPQVTVDGRLALAERTGELMGLDGPMWCGPREQWGGDLVWHEVWMDDEHPPYCARVLVHRRDRDNPTANGTAKWSEFTKLITDGGNRPLPAQWRSMPSHMLGKVALNMALRRAFSEVIDIPVEAEFDAVEAEAMAPAPDASPAPNTPAARAVRPEPLAPRPEPLAPRPEPSPDEWVMPTREQTQRANELFGELGLGGRANAEGRRYLTSEALGHTVTDTRTLSRGDFDRLLPYLAAKVLEAREGAVEVLEPGTRPEPEDQY
jgi:hypothetical protein